MFEQAFKAIDDILRKEAGCTTELDYTPRPLIRAIVQVVKPEIGNRIYDGACGSAGFLCESFEYLKHGPGNANHPIGVGKKINPANQAIGGPGRKS